MTATWRLSAVVVLALVLTACSSGGSDDATSGPTGPATPATDRLGEPIEPAQDPPDGLEPIDPPAGFAKVEGFGFTLHAPEGFTTQQKTSSNGEPMLVLTTGATGSDESGTLVGVVREVNPTAGVLEQTKVLAGAKRDISEATGVRRTVVAWPGTTAAVLVEWTVQKGGAGPTSSRMMRTVQLSADIDDKLGIAVVATAPADAFDDSQVATILRTFRPTKATT